MLIIPAIDLISGQCVRLEQGRYDKKKVYSRDPLEVAKDYEAHGITHLHLVDLDGAKSGTVINWDVLKRIVQETSLIVDWGGGIKSNADIEKVFECGAAQVTVGSTAVKDPDLFRIWLSKYGERLILGADLKDGKIAMHGWKETSEMTWRDLFDMYIPGGVKRIISTDVSRDGMLTGPSISLYREMISAYPGIQLIASGGISKMEDLTQLKTLGCYGAIIGKAIYEQKISLKQLENFSAEC